MTPAEAAQEGAQRRAGLDREAQDPPRAAGAQGVRMLDVVAARETRAFRAALERAGLPRSRFHDLRHAAATFLLAQGVTLKDVKQLLGHSSITLTSNTHGHVQEQ
jgi:integrase